MAPQRKRGTVSPTLLAFGRRLRRFRKAKGWTQENLACRAHNGMGVTPQYIGAVENGRARCTREFAASLDSELGANNELLDLYDDLVKDAAFPLWFDWYLVEPEADEIESYSLSVVDGLFQTPAYAAVLLRDEEAVEARMKRQEVFARKNPPKYSLLLDEGVLYRPAGNAEIMREQLKHLATIPLERASIQIVPASAEHDGNSGSFYIATMEDRTQVAYVESGARGLTMSEPEDLATLSRTMKDLRSLALPVSQSKDLILRTVKERWST
ncbi:helix-turn-helix protein [Actinomadura pelletieri DSM 43383]|uniref:XRE family transcriptional regulator n=2 Tax=Actinomadura TaxID=1988 RepID=A0A372GGY5_9ACTN|nr:MULTISPECIES: helix-turn-helix transcriptional regulator [Actinomadura]RFS84635.1 XRE family transcriptional regulator [Actinomadura spongiicola]RKS72120.1 helix-turn-helix protein [Actinomadura pelletieri DSM 43383]